MKFMKIFVIVLFEVYHAYQEDEDKEFLKNK
jgi:hypothetical protein